MGEQSRNPVLEKITVNILTFVLLSPAILFVVKPNTHACKEATRYLRGDGELKMEIVKNLSLTAFRAVQISSYCITVAGNANINFTVERE